MSHSAVNGEAGHREVGFGEEQADSLACCLLGTSTLLAVVAVAISVVVVVVVVVVAVVDAAVVVLVVVDAAVVVVVVVGLLWDYFEVEQKLAEPLLQAELVVVGR